MAKPELDFKSKEEFRQLCRYISMRLHYLNRVAIGESGFAWNVADMIQRTGKVFDDHLDDKAVQADFGVPYSIPNVPREDRPRALLDLMYPPKKSGEGGT